MIKAFLIITVIFVFIFTGCNKQGELQGSVFIVTQGAQNIKLGLVKVTAIPENEIKQFVEQKKSIINGESNKLKSDMDAIKPEIAKSQKEFDEAKRNYDEIVAQRDNLKSREQSLNLGFNPYSLNEDPYLSEYETPEMKAERNKQRQIQKQLDAIRKQIASYEPKVSQASKIMTDAKSRLEMSKSNLSKITDKLVSYVQASFLFDGLPEGKIKAVTDADGKFSMKLPSGKYALVASSERRVVNTTEEYYWLIWVDIDGKEPKQIMLTNQNLLGQDSEDGVFKLKELIPSLDKPDKTPNSVTSSV
jgi:hypothetical protein